MVIKKLSKYFWNPEPIFDYGHYCLSSSVLITVVYLANWTDQLIEPHSVSSVSDWYWTRWSSSYQPLCHCHSVFLTFFFWQIFKATNTSKFPDFIFFVKPDTSCMSSVDSGFISRLPLQGLVWGSLVGSHALCFLCRSVSWAELIPLMLPSPHSSADRAGRSTTLVSLEKLVSLNPADSNKHTPLLSSPQQMDCCQNKDPLEEILLPWNSFLVEWKHLMSLELKQ